MYSILRGAEDKEQEVQHKDTREEMTNAQTRTEDQAEVDTSKKPVNPTAPKWVNVFPTQNYYLLFWVPCLP